MGERQPWPRREGREAGDAALAQAARDGDADAFGTLVERHYGAVYRLAAALLGDGPDAEDAVQEAFVRAYQHLRGYDPRRPFGPWLRGVAVNVCRQHGRRRAQHERRLAAIEAAATEAGQAPSEHLRVKNALTRLAEAYRLPLVLFYLEEASVAEVAQALGLSVGATRVRLHRGREKLRRILAESEAWDREQGR